MTIPFGKNRRRDHPATPFNMTPVIDIVFLLIIFFMVVSKFIEAENFPVAVPTGCEFAELDPHSPDRATTVTVMKAEDATVHFAVGPEKINALASTDIIDQLARLIDLRLRDLPTDRRIVTLRADKEISFSHAQYALAAIAQSSATDIHLATLRHNTADP